MEAPVSEHTVELFMDYGQFCLHGGLGELEDEMPLLEQALAAQPCAANGTSVLVLNPHQNNFRMPVTVQVWTARPPADRDAWQQVCEARLRIGPDGKLAMTSPVDGYAECPVPEGEYLIEVSGRGFVNYGWPGSTEPGDEWRLRLWPDDGGEPLPARRWEMPGYGVPENSPAPEPQAPAKHEEPERITMIDASEPELVGYSGPQLVSRSELLERKAAAERERWGGEPIPRLDVHWNAHEIARYDRGFAEAVAAMDDSRLRELARWAAHRAYEKAGIADKPWVRPALTALTNGAPLPPPFDDLSTAFERLFAEEREQSEDDEVVTAEWSMTIRGAASELPANPFAGEDIHRGAFALPALEHATDENALRAALTCFYEAALVYGADAEELFAAARAAFGLPPR